MYAHIDDKDWIEKPEKKEPEKVIGAALKNGNSSVNSPSKVRTESY